MSTGDPLHELLHDHGELNRMVLGLGASIVRGAGSGSVDGRPLIQVIAELREDLFRHFAREEEGLFPFISETIPELDERVQQLAIAHDTICGAIARLFHLAITDARPSALEPLYTRFEAAYGHHATLEAELLRHLEGRLDATQRIRLADLVRGL